MIPGVLHVVNLLTMGGTERQLVELVRATDRARWRPHVASLVADGELRNVFTELGCPPAPFPLGGSLLRPRAAAQVARMALLCRRRGVKIIHAHDLYSNVVAAAAGPLAGARVIASRRDLGDWLTARQRRLLRLACRAADAVLVNARPIAELARAEGTIGEKVHVVPNGIDVEAFDARAARGLAGPPLPPREGGAARAVMIGNMDRELKGHGDLIAAAALLRARGVAVDWVLLSEGPLRGRFEAEARAAGVAGAVHFVGHRKDVPAVLREVDLLVHPSWSEGFPNVVMEAMCARVPVVTTGIGGTHELVEDGVTGRLVPARAPEALADAVEWVVRHRDEARRLAAAARARVAEGYSLRRMVQRVDELYSQLLSRSPAPCPAAPRASTAAPWTRRRPYARP